MLRFTWNYHQLYYLRHYVTANYVIMLSTVSIVYHENSNYYIYVVYLSLHQISILPFICRYNDYQYRGILIVVIKRYDFKDETLSSFDSTDGIYQAGEDVVGRETPITKPTT